MDSPLFTQIFTRYCALIQKCVNHTSPHKFRDILQIYNDKMNVPKSLLEFNHMNVYCQTKIEINYIDGIVKKIRDFMNKPLVIEKNEIYSVYSSVLDNINYDEYSLIHTTQMGIIYAIKKGENKKIILRIPNDIYAIITGRIPDTTHDEIYDDLFDMVNFNDEDDEISNNVNDSFMFNANHILDPKMTNIEIQYQENNDTLNYIPIYNEIVIMKYIIKSILECKEREFKIWTKDKKKVLLYEIPPGTSTVYPTGYKIYSDPINGIILENDASMEILMTSSDYMKTLTLSEIIYYINLNNIKFYKVDQWGKQFIESIVTICISNMSHR